MLKKDRLLQITVGYKDGSKSKLFVKTTYIPSSLLHPVAGYL